MIGTAEHSATITDRVEKCGQRFGFEASHEDLDVDVPHVVTDLQRRLGGSAGVLQFLPGSYASVLFDVLAPVGHSSIAQGSKLSFWEATPHPFALGEQRFAGNPVGGQGPIWYFNKELFRKSGLDPETPPATWAELKHAAVALIRAGIQPIGQSGADGVLAWWAWNSSSPQSFSSEECQSLANGRLSMSNPRFLESLMALRELYEEGLVVDCYPKMRAADVGRMFSRGEVAIIPGIISLMMNWSTWDQTLGADEYGVFTAPSLEGTTLRGQALGPTFVYGFLSRSAQDLACAEITQALVTGTLRDFPHRLEHSPHP